jgi:hypothetical protein
MFVNLIPFPKGAQWGSMHDPFKSSSVHVLSAVVYDLSYSATTDAADIAQTTTQTSRIAGALFTSLIRVLGELWNAFHKCSVAPQYPVTTRSSYALTRKQSRAGHGSIERHRGGDRSRTDEGLPQDGDST